MAPLGMSSRPREQLDPRLTTCLQLLQLNRHRPLLFRSVPRKRNQLPLKSLPRKHQRRDRKYSDIKRRSHWSQKHELNALPECRVACTKGRTADITWSQCCDQTGREQGFTRVQEENGHSKWSGPRHDLWQR